jgi:hypothetical protein
VINFAKCVPKLRERPITRLVIGRNRETRVFRHRHQVTWPVAPVAPPVSMAV